MKVLTLVAILALRAPLAHGETSFSSLVKHVQDTYLPKAAPYPILILDRDDLEWRFTLAGATGAEKADAARRETILKAYVKEKTGVTITDNAAANFEPYLSELTDAALAMPALAEDYSTVQMCAVFPPDPNRNQRLETERLLQLHTAQAYGDHQYAELRNTLPYDDAVLYSLLHESAHCMDRYFFPKLIEGQSDPGSIHQAESYAEAAALFLMAKEGRSGVAEARAYLRDLYSYFMEPYFVAHPELGMGNDAYSSGGLIYHLAPSIRGAAALMVAKPGMVPSMPLPDLLALAKQVVDQNALDFRLITALFSGYSEGHETALARYRGYESSYPDLFAGIVDKLQKYWRSETEFKGAAFGPLPPAPPETTLLPFDVAGACTSLQRGDVGSLGREIEGLRQNLRSGNPSPDAEAQRFSQLSDLWKTLPARCKGESLAERRTSPSAPFLAPSDVVRPLRLR